MAKAPRNKMLDSLRFLAIVGVIFLHYPFEPSVFSEAVRVSARWAVPFFFLLTGCFLPAENGFTTISAGRLQSITTVAFVASLLYLPLALLTIGLSVLNPVVFVYGTWFHLWFLNAMVIGLLLLLIAPGVLRRPVAVDCAAIGIIAFYFGADMFNSYIPSWGGIVNLLRELSGFAFIWLGFRLAAVRPMSVVKPVIVMVLSVLLIVLEVLFWNSHGVSMFQRQLPFGAITFAIGLILFGFNFPYAPSWLARIGRELVLPIYVLHPLFLKLSDIVLGGIMFLGPAQPYVIVIFGLSLSTLAAAALMWFWPAAGRILNGATFAPTAPARPA